MKIFIISNLFIVISSYSFSQKYYSNQSIEDILKLPENEINIGIASLVLAKEFYSNLNVQYFLQTFDYLADRYNYYFGKHINPDDRIAALNTYIYKAGFWNDSITFSYDDDDLQVTKLENKFINGYIANKKGSCITMPMLYVILGERLNFPIYPVRSAKHFFVRYILEKVDKKFKQNIETTNGGGFISDKQYKEDVLISDKAIKNGVYLRTLSKKEYIASLLMINANEYIKQKNTEKAKHYFQLAIKYDSTFSSAYWNFGITAFGEARELEEKMWAEKQNVINENNVFVELTTEKQNDETNLFEPKNDTKNDPFEKNPTMPQIMLIELVNKPQIRIQKENNRTHNQVLYQADLQPQLMEIEKKYEPLIKEKIRVYKEYTHKAERLGIVHEFPIRFYEKQSESIKKFKQNEGY